MPELPEVQTRLLFLRRTALGQTVKDVAVNENGIIRQAGLGYNRDRSCVREFIRGLRGRTLVDAFRRGKYLIVTLDNGRALILHFTMGGDLAFYKHPSERPAYTRIELKFESGWRMAFTCPRNICRVMLVDEPSEVPGIRTMGPEPLSREFTLSYMKRILRSSASRRIKPLLMDQTKIAGVGNIYADEILFEARVSPLRIAGELDDQEVKKLHHATKRVLKLAVNNPSEPELPPEYLMSRYAEGLPCARCSGKLDRIRINGRSAYLCPRCQK